MKYATITLVAGLFTIQPAASVRKFRRRHRRKRNSAPRLHPSRRNAARMESQTRNVQSRRKKRAWLLFAHGTQKEHRRDANACLCKI